MIKRIFITSFILLGSLVGIARGSISYDVSQAIKHTMPNAMVGVSVADMKTGQLIYNYHAYDYFTPASNEKVLTASAALYALGANYRFHTTMSANANAISGHTLTGNLYVNFVGDPSFKTADLINMIQQLKHKGVSKINGNVVLDTSKFEAPNYAPGWTVNSMNWGYSAPITAVTLNENSTGIRIAANHQIGSHTPVKMLAYGDLIPITSKLEAASQADANSRCSIVLRMNMKNELYVGGCWPALKDPSTLSIAIRNPTLYMQKLLLELLKKEGIQLTGDVITGKKPSGLRVMVDHTSAPLNQLIKHMLKNSDNFYAECLLKTLGQKYYDRGTFQTGVLAMESILTKHTGVNFHKITDLYDGSGQSYYDYIQPRYMVKLLYKIYHSSIYHVFYAALPISGHDGTLAYRMGTKSLSGRVHAKTGSLTAGKSTLSGYVVNAKGHTLAFSIMVNNYVRNIRNARQLQDKIVEALYRN